MNTLEGSISAGSILKIMLLVVSVGLMLLPAASAQIYNPGSESYQRVFVETDQFDSSYLDQLELAVSITAEDSLRIVMLNDLAYCWHTRNLGTAIQWCRRGIQSPQLVKYPNLNGRLLSTYASILLRNEQLDSAELLLDLAKDLVLDEDKPFLYTQLGYIWERRGELGRAADQASLALQAATTGSSIAGVAQAYSDLCYLSWKQSKTQKALDYGLESLALFEQRDLADLDHSFALYVVGTVYQSLKQFDQARRYFERSNGIASRYGFYNNLCDNYIALTDLHTELGEYKQAEQYSREAVKYAQLLDNAFMLMRSWLSIGKLQNLTGEFDNAIQSLGTSMEIATKDFGDDFVLQQVYEQLALAYAGMGDFEQAYAALQSYDLYKNQVFTNEADRRIVELQTQFEVEQKEGTIAAQQGELRQRIRIQWLTAGFLALILIVLCIIVFNYRKNRKLGRSLTLLNQDLASKNEALDRSNLEKEVLLKEIHHRVKNNLEIVASLLELQSASVQDQAATDVMLASQQRVQSMGIIHQRLYQGDDLASIEMKDYFKNLGEGILEAFDAHEQVEILIPMKPIILDVDSAVPIGLIVNELITNSLKYAFPDGRDGEIKVQLVEEEDQLHLSVSDDGIGSSKDLAPKGTGFGSQLIQLLTTQLNGTMQVTNRSGTSTSFVFRNAKVIRK